MVMNVAEFSLSNWMTFAEWLLAHEYETQACVVLGRLANESPNDPTSLKQKTIILEGVIEERESSPGW